jgi:Protein of unknown function (DUF1573)
MSKTGRLIFAIASNALFLAGAQAELVFEQTAIELHPAIGDEKAVAHFKYQNKGDKAVAIKGTSTSCGCTAATAKQSAEPGEKGEVAATFTVGDRVGTQQKIITVTTDDPAHPATQLHLTVFIPQLLELQPGIVFWQPNESPAAKTIVAKVGKDASVTNLDVTSANPDFTTKVEPGTGGEFRISITPKDTSKPSAAMVTIKPVVASGKSKNFYATVRVLPAAGQPPTAIAGTVPPANMGKLNPCSFLTSKEIESIQGEPLKTPSGSSKIENGMIQSQCYFGLPNSANSISLVVTQRAEGADGRSPKQFWEQAFHREQKEEKERDEEKRAEKKQDAGKQGEEEEAPPPKKITGVGEEAFWTGNRFGGALYVLRGDTFIRVSVGGAGDESSKIEKSKKLARMVLKRL